MEVLFAIYLLLPMDSDLRDDKQFFENHPGSVPITNAQVNFCGLGYVSPLFLFSLSYILLVSMMSESPLLKITLFFTRKTCRERS